MQEVAKSSPSTIGHMMVVNSRGDDKLKISSRKVSIWGSILQTMSEATFQYIFCFESFKKKPTMAKLLFRV